MGNETKREAWTPGPWQVGDNGYNANLITTVARETEHGGKHADRTICTVYGINQNRTVTEMMTSPSCAEGFATAQLIALAPEMAALLQRLGERLQGGVAADDLDAIRALLARLPGNGAATESK